jgi:hypothetical protein
MNKLRGNLELTGPPGNGKQTKLKEYLDFLGVDYKIKDVLEGKVEWNVYYGDNWEIRVTSHTGAIYMGSKYSWCITVDKINNDDNYPKRVGLVGPRASTITFEEIKKSKNKKLFRMLDDDREVYYHGYIVGEFDGFEPLDDFGTPNDGCTIIQYKNSEGKWVDL